MTCLRKVTHVSMHLCGSVPNALYTGWVVVFDEPGFDPDPRDIASATKHIVG